MKSAGRLPCGSRSASSSTRRTWIEIAAETSALLVPESSSTRRTWIEIKRAPPGRAGHKGRPPHGGRGLKWGRATTTATAIMSSSTRRTWIEMQKKRGPLPCGASSSTRRTWIEIFDMNTHFGQINCRPPHGGRGLKSADAPPPRCRQSSSSTRRTWIEIRPMARTARPSPVVLHTEDVD